jgi:hypothetical protein
MNEFQNFETSVLVDLLARHTQRLTELFSHSHLTPEYEDCKKMILELQSEIIRRKNETLHSSRASNNLSVESGERPGSPIVNSE